jgi:prepilin-type N-terminal cleavage/methylation domain-containing protein
MQSRKNKPGFSLSEILVAIAILAVVAAVVIPSIGGQLRSGDESRVQNDLANIRSGIEQFLADVRRYPKSVGQLTTAPTITASGLTGGVYNAGQVGRYRGPYISKDSLTAVKTGFDGTITNLFDTATVTGFGGPYLRMTIATFDSTNAARLDQKMDDGVLTTGMIRWTAVASPSGNLFYYALPIQ